MDEQLDTQQPSYVSVIAVLPDDERHFFSINTEITVKDFIDILKNNGFISNLAQDKFSILHSGKILNDEEKFSTFPNSDHIILYILFRKTPDTSPLCENNLNSDLIHNTENYFDNHTNNDDLQFANLQNLNDFGNFAILQRFFNYNFFPFAYRQRMEDEDPILGEDNNNHEPQVNPRLIKAFNFVIMLIYFIIGFSLGYRSIFIFIFICLFSSPKISNISSIFEGVLVRFSWDLISPFIF